MKIHSPIQKQDWLRRSIRVFVLGALLTGMINGFATRPSQASLPVIDAAAISQAFQNYEQLAKQLEVLYQQLQLAQTQVQNETGHYGHGTSIGVIDDWQSTSWDDISDMVRSGVNPGDGDQVKKFKEARDAAKARFPAIDPSLQSSNPRVNNVDRGQYADAIAGMSESRAAFEAVAQQLKDLEILRQQIDATDNLKSAVDLNTTVNVKAAQLSAQLALLQTFQLQLQASHANAETSGAAAQAEFMASN